MQRFHRLHVIMADGVQETLDARFEYAPDDSDGVRHHRINQYVIKEEIGRGSYGAVHLATDQFGNEYVCDTYSNYVPFLDATRIGGVLIHMMNPGRQGIFQGTTSQACAVEPP